MRITYVNGYSRDSAFDGDFVKDHMTIKGAEQLIEHG
jgi:hypothetical protein